MTIAIHAGRKAADVRAHLDTARNALRDVQNAHRAIDAYNAYLKWAGAQMRVLRSYIAAEALDRLVSTDYFRSLSLLDPAGKGDAPLRALVDVEIERQQEEFALAIRELDAAIARHGAAQLMLVVDTNVYLHHQQPFEEVPWADLAGDAAAVHVAVPLLVIDELDRNKLSSAKVRRDGPETVRSRARTTLRTLEERFANDQVFDLDTAGQVHVSAVFVPEDRGHIRLPRADDELVDIASGLAAFTDGRVAVVTDDTGLRLRARLAGLDAIEPPGNPHED